MKIQIDFDNKTIKLDSKENLGKFIDLISKMMPEWRDYSLETNTVINWSNPTVIYRDRYWDNYGYYQKPYYGGTGTTNASLGNGINMTNVTYKADKELYTLTANKTGLLNLELKEGQEG